MNILKTITAIALFMPLTFSIGTSFSYAQSSVMKDPVSYTLKNGMTVIIAENEATPKVFANLSFEAAGKYQADKATVQEVFTTLMNQELTAMDAGLSYSDKGINLATQHGQFETALQQLYAYINTPAFNQDAFAKAKATVLAHLTAQDKYFPPAVNQNSLAKLTLDDVNAYYNEINIPAQTVLTVAGNITPGLAKNYTKKAMNQRKPAAENDKTYLVSNN